MYQQRGFTLIELLVVIAIIGILSSVVLSSVNLARKKGQIAQAKSELTQIRTAINLLATDTGLWPRGKTIDVIETGVPNNEIWDLNPAVVGLVATNGSFPNWHGPYISTVPLDPWGNPYFFDTDYQADLNGNPCPGCADVAAIGSFGPDGVGQNLYNSDDIILILAR